MKSDQSASSFPLSPAPALPHISPSAEAVVDERLAHRPDVYLLALTQFATRPDTVEVVCHALTFASVSPILIAP